MAETTDAPLSLAAKIAHVQAIIGGIAADKTARIQSDKANYSYDYLSEGGIFAAVRSHLAPLGVATLPSTKSIDRQGNLTTVAVEITFMDGDSGQVVTIESVGQGTDPGDKGASKAVTSAVRVGLSKAFLQAGGVDPEQEAHEATSGGGSARSNGNGHNGNGNGAAPDPQVLLRLSEELRASWIEQGFSPEETDLGIENALKDPRCATEPWFREALRLSQKAIRDKAAAS